MKSKRTPSHETKLNSIETKIRDYLLEEGLLREKLTDPRFEFGFRFQFPNMKGSQGQDLGRSMLIVKPKNKNLVELSCATQIAPQHVKALTKDSLTRSRQFYKELRRLFFEKEVFFNIDPRHHRFVVIDNFFIENEDSLTKNRLFQSIRKLFSTTMLALVLLEEYLPGMSGGIDSNELKLL